MQDVRIIEALYKSARTGRAVSIAPFRDRKQPTRRQQITRPGVKEPDVVKVKAPAG
jgi:hypothetical protein